MKYYCTACKRGNFFPMCPLCGLDSAKPLPSANEYDLGWLASIGMAWPSGVSEEPAQVDSDPED